VVSLSITSAGQRESWGSDEYFDPTRVSVVFTIVTNALHNSTLPMVRPLSDRQIYARTMVASPPLVFVAVWMAFFFVLRAIAASD
jgi:hypothetical protein